MKWEGRLKGVKQTASQRGKKIRKKMKEILRNIEERARMIKYTFN